VIVRRDWRTPAHERYNCEWILEQDIGARFFDRRGTAG
jgi:hypothetical protein